MNQKIWIILPRNKNSYYLCTTVLHFEVESIVPLKIKYYMFTIKTGCLRNGKYITRMVSLPMGLFS